MRAPSSDAELESRPNVSAVIDRILAVLETLGPNQKQRRDSLEAVVKSLKVGLRPGDDISDEEREKWLESLA